MGSSYRKIVCNGYTRSFRAAAEIAELPQVPPGPGQVLVRNRFGGVNASDVNIAAGVYFSDGTFPFDLGCESVGEVLEVGQGVNNVAPGDFVVSPSLGSAYGELIYRDALQVLKVPECSPEVMTAVVCGCTASIGLQTVGQMGSGETVLITAAAGGVGSWCVQLAKLAGNHVIGTCSTEEKASELRRLGCDRVIVYRNEDLATVLRTEYPNGIDLVFEQVGQETFDTCVDNIAERGRIVICGFISEYTSGPQPVTAPRIYHKLLWKSAQLRAFLFSHWPDELPGHIVANLALVESGSVDPLVDRRVFNGLEQVVDAVEYLHAGGNSGKVVIRYP